MSLLFDTVLPFLSRIFPRGINRLKIDYVVSRERCRRPHPFALWTGMTMGPPPANLPRITLPPPNTAPAAPPADAELPPVPFRPASYVSWPGLVDRSFTGRHLPPNEAWIGDLPDPDKVFQTILLRPPGDMVPCKKTSALFCFFAQWFTDSFLRTDPRDRRRHTGNNEIDFCQIYGLDEATCFALRARKGGLMLMRDGPRGALLPFLAKRDDAGKAGDVDPRFAALGYIDHQPGQKPGQGYRDRMQQIMQRLGPTGDDPARWATLYATGLDRGNSTIFYTALSTMCVREHNRLARSLAVQHPQWDDDRLFETARLINVHNVLEIVVEDYINHIAGDAGFRLDPDFAERRPWYRTNRISLEFNLLYRWHSLVPDGVEVGGTLLDNAAYRFNNQLLEASSPEQLINDASRQPAGRIGLYNTPAFLAPAEASSINMGREFRLQPFNAYCDRFQHKPYSSIEHLVGGDARAAADLNRLYGGDVDKVDFVVGLLAEARGSDDLDAALPPLLRKMVAVDAFTHILTNPILSAQVRETVFDDVLKPYVTDTGGVTGLMKRNSAAGQPIAVPSFKV